MYTPTHEVSISSTQAGGAAAVTVPARANRGRYYHHTVQAEVTLTATGAPATPTAGTLSVRGRLPGATGYQELGVIQLTAPEPAVFDGFYDSIEAVSTGFDADKTWTLNIVSGD